VDDDAIMNDDAGAPEDDDTDDDGARDITPRETPLEPERRLAEARDIDALVPLCDRAQLERSLAKRELAVWTDANDVAIGGYAVERARSGLTVRGIALTASHRGRGLAARVLREMIDEAIRAHTTVACEVPTDAARALQLLRHLGFVVVPGARAGTIRLVWRVA
jgi:GNAT superfamily N-acetyltransferase